MQENSQASANAEREFTTMLIELYRDFPELWQIKHKEYFNRNKKGSALEKICNELKHQCDIHAK